MPRSSTGALSITIDYGDLAQHLYTEDRPQGTLLAYHRHLPLEDALSAPGEIDLTAHVNFSALIDAGKEAGLELTGFTSQERFLLALGEANQFADLYEPGATEVENLQARLKLKRLIHPEGMGNVFKVLDPASRDRLAEVDGAEIREHQRLIAGVARASRPRSRDVRASRALGEMPRDCGRDARTPGGNNRLFNLAACSPARTAS